MRGAPRDQGPPQGSEFRRRASGGRCRVLGLQTPRPGELRALLRKPGLARIPENEPAIPRGMAFILCTFVFKTLQALDPLFPFTFGHSGSRLETHLPPLFPSDGCFCSSESFPATWHLAPVPGTSEGSRREAGSGDHCRSGFAGQPFVGDPSLSRRPPRDPALSWSWTSSSVTAVGFVGAREPCRFTRTGPPSPSWMWTLASAGLPP